MKTTFIRNSILFLFIFGINISFAQNIKFGNISEEELKEEKHPLESDANAAILYSSREVFYGYNSQDGLYQENRYHLRLKIYTKDGYNYAKKEIGLYEQNSGTREKLFEVKGATYNLENGKIVKSKLKSSGIFKEEITEHFIKKTITFSNVKEGSVIDLKYKIRSPFLTSIDASIIQENIPIKLLKQRILIPGLISFNLHYGGRHPFNVNQSMQNETYGSESIETDVYEILEKNIPSLKSEPYSGNLEDYRSRIDFEIRSIRPIGGVTKDYAKTWESVCKAIYENKNFGDQLEKTKHFTDELTVITSTSKSKMETAQKIYAFVKNKIKWNENTGKYTEKGVKKAFKEGIGNVADINLTLISMLRAANLQAHPVLISTRNHGKTMFPTLDGFNYVIAYLKDQNGNEYLLDATDRTLAFGSLPDRTLNWTGQLITENLQIRQVTLPSYIKATQKRNISVKIDEDGFITGNVRTSYDNRFAYYYRKSLGSLSKEKLMEKIEEQNEAIEVTNCRASNVTDLQKPIMEVYQFESEEGVQKVGNELYFDSMLYWGDSKNIFTADERKLPIDFISAWNETNIVQFNIPNGYTLKAKPEDFNTVLPEDIGLFTFKIEQKGNKIIVYSIVEFQKTLITPEYYNDIKGMLDKVVEKHAEKIILIKN
ncbi:transglutaminase domain-containing protein [Aureivirga marina]|uniref:transglutaminase domain-containing protein n=1 Tax=Aureivirga marina TaxID=1182451 RepID=UPI0018C8DB41|nr:transglutaminase domain-containing protein [Aureivirga marina]